MYSVLVDMFGVSTCYFKKYLTLNLKHCPVWYWLANELRVLRVPTSMMIPNLQASLPQHADDGRLTPKASFFVPDIDPSDAWLGLRLPLRSAAKSMRWCRRAGGGADPTALRSALTRAMVSSGPCSLAG